MLVLVMKASTVIVPETSSVTEGEKGSKWFQYKGLKSYFEFIFPFDWL